MRYSMFVLVLILIFGLFAAAQTAPPAPSPQNPSPMVEHTRAHVRIPKTELAGRHFPLSMGTLFLSQSARIKPEMPLFIHFHGADWLVEESVHDVNPRAAVLSITLGAGSGVYARAFEDQDRFSQLLDEAARALDPQHPPKFKPVVLSGFSAGCGALRAILRNHENWARISAVVFVDGIHTGYIPDGAPGPLDPAPIQPILDFAREAAAGKYRMIVTHSEIFPGTYASTTETADYLLDQLHLKAHPVLKWGPGGMQQLSDFHAVHLYILGFAGNSAPDHVDQFQGLSEWLKLATKH